MKVKLINKKVAIGLLLILLIVSYKIYSNKPVNEIDTSLCHIEYGVRYGLDSPDNKHTVIVDICKEDKSSNESYIKGELVVSKDRVYHVLKTIYWEKVASSEVSNGLDGDDYWETCDVEWIDNQHIRINGRVIDIYKGYDYRDKEN
ncbi:hypothetical protein CWE04_10175 [Thomasclavelia cocleata]|uniref:DUF5412 domain-containing protein n=1 Tax=Thomasclavelia cocleata TaxID=69824 RepID=A0A1I0C670_9FIRM|nr:hypothetical protein [Thomasclavelia cocleata]MCR1959616.1 DUF5412 domain-containing protein [Thomasclavelia cocleata]NDO42239.1 hypothetical protein [Thomasclavelia cocleata]PJN80099.1 hypothetical protein CWE04_10175 [Thomasclavelia cocleata]SET14984.1 hypothetical protein SAMN04489758_102103 [Thomasclavelia cocleata]